MELEHNDIHRKSLQGLKAILPIINGLTHYEAMKVLDYMKGNLLQTQVISIDTQRFKDCLEEWKGYYPDPS